MISIILLSLAGICAIIYFISKKEKPHGNRYRREKIVSRAHEYEKKSFSEFDESESETDVLCSQKPEKKEAEAVSAKPVNQPECLVVFYLMAKEECVYTGYELLQALLSAGLRFGKRGIFHRHASKEGRGDILFHCASAMAPGTFDLTKMGAFSCKGLSLFFSTADVQDPMATLDILLETVDQLLEDLDGVILDDERKPLTKDRIFHYRQQIGSLETRKVTADLFE